MTYGDSVRTWDLGTKWAVAAQMPPGAKVKEEGRGERVEGGGVQECKGHEGNSHGHAKANVWE